MEMAGVKMLVMIAVIFFSVAAGGKGAVAEKHHVVGDEYGWKPSTDLVSWISGRIFRVGDIIWFIYSATEDSIVEVKTLEEFLTCDLTNPVKMYKDGLNKVPLESEGVRFFSSGNVEGCRSGLKLPVKVQPKEQNGLAAAPTSPSASTSLTAPFYTLLLGLVLCFFVL